MNLLLPLLLALPAAGADRTDDPMIRWDCDRAGNRLVLELVRPPVAEVKPRDVFLLSGDLNFVQCRLAGGNWTLLVDIVEYDSGRCEPEPDTIVSLLRDDTLVISRVVVSRNCGNRPVLSGARVSDPHEDAEPGIEVCAAPGFGEEGRCAPLALRQMQAPLDDQALAARAAEDR
jgi:hypothetical protein